MGKTLIIAEKPSLARNIVAAINPKPEYVTVDQNARLGYYESDKYIVASAVGHLLSLKDAGDYRQEWSRWDADNLPVFPTEFAYKVKEERTRPVLELLKKLISRDDVEKVVNAGDSDREGEIIIRNVFNYADNTKPAYRLWMPDQTPKTISAQLASMRPETEYDNLANEGYARTYIDWLYGINLTRLATAKAADLLRVGRVTSPIVLAIRNREKEIREFRPETYYTCVHNSDGLKLTSENRFATIAEAEALAAQYNTLPLTVTNVESKKQELNRPRLFALSDLQDLCGKKFRITPKVTLDVVQKLYESGYVTYPRTNADVMAENEKDKAKEIIDAIKSAIPNDFDGISFRDSKQVFDDKRIEAHSAITPTTKIPSFSDLDDLEQKVYATILARFAAAFCTEKRTVLKTTATIDNGLEQFSVSGEAVITKGFAEFEPVKAGDEVPKLSNGDIIAPAFQAERKETQPPKHYTVGTLNEYLKHPYSKMEKADLQTIVEKSILDDVELGTEATRAGLIDGAIQSGYITLEKNRYGITDKGEYYCQWLDKLGMDMTKDRTLSLSTRLKDIYRDECTIDEAVDQAKTDILSIINTGRSVAGVKRESKAVAICKCSECGGSVTESPKAFSCGGCGRIIFKDNKFCSGYGIKVSPSLVKAIFTNGEVYVKDMFSQKKQKKFSTYVVCAFPDGGKYPRFSFDFDKKPPKS